jgi:AcrR family transcriptional regulator
MSMDPKPSPVKPARMYDGTARRERASQLRASTLDVAYEMFQASGFAATTVESIAQAAAVSAATIYKTYGGKAGLIRALCDRALAGSGPVPAEERSDALRSMKDPRTVIEGWGRLASEVSPRISPLLLWLREAGRLDADAAALFRELDGNRLRRMADNAGFLADAGHLRHGVTKRDARDIMWFLTAPDTYDLLVNQRRWSVRKYSSWMAETIAATLL